MDCPFCGNKMRPGIIPAGQYGMRWLSRDNSGTMEVDEVLVAKSRMFWGEDAEAFYCPDCRRIILPVPDIETTGRKMKKKLDEFSDKVEKAQESWKQRRAERREDEKWNKRKGKDPWEW